MINIEYKILYSTTVQDVEDNVSDLLSKGWNLVGGISTVCNKYGEVQYTQAMMIDKTPTDDWDV